MSLGDAGALEYDPWAGEGLTADAAGFPPSVAVAMLVALVAGLIAYGQSPGVAPPPASVTAELGPVLTGDAEEAWLAAQVTGGRKTDDLAAGRFDAGDSIEALL